MALKPLEDLWKTSLNEILEQLDDLQYEKMVMALDRIPRAVKASKSRLDLAQLLVQYYGTTESIHTVTKILDEIPRRDAAVQDPLRLVHQELEKHTKRTNKKKKSCLPANDQTKRETLMKSKSVDVPEPSCIKRKTDEAKPVRAKMRKDPSILLQSFTSAAQSSEVKTQSSMKSDNVYLKDPNKVVGVVQPQKPAVLQKQSSLVEVGPEQVPKRIRLMVVKEVYKKKVYVFAEEPDKPGTIRELEVTPRRLALAFGLNNADANFKDQLHLHLPAYVNVQLNGKVIVKLEKEL